MALRQCTRTLYTSLWSVCNASKVTRAVYGRWSMLMLSARQSMVDGAAAAMVDGLVADAVDELVQRRRVQAAARLGLHLQLHELVALLEAALDVDLGEREQLMRLRRHARAQLVHDVGRHAKGGLAGEGRRRRAQRNGGGVEVRRKERLHLGPPRVARRDLGHVHLFLLAQ